MKILDTSDTLHNMQRKLVASTCFDRAHGLYMEKNHSAAKVEIERAISIYETMHDETKQGVTVLGFSYRLLGETLLAQKQYDEAKATFMKALRLFEQHLDTINAMVEEANLNRVSRAQSIEEGTPYVPYQSPDAITPEIEKIMTEAYQIFDEASECFSQRKLEEARDKGLRVLEMVEDIAPFEIRRATRTFLGNVYSVLEDSEHAIEMYRTALSLGRANEKEDCYLMLELGNEYSNIEKKTEAEKQYREALSLAQRGGHTEYEARAHANMGVVQALRGDKAEARKSFGEAKDLFAQLGDTKTVERIESSIVSYEL